MHNHFRVCHAIRGISGPILMSRGLVLARIIRPTHRGGLPHVQARSTGRPIYHHKREFIEANLTIVFAAAAVSHWIEAQTGWSIKKFVRTARRYRTVQIRAGRQILTGRRPLPNDLRDAIAKIDRRRRH